MTKYSKWRCEKAPALAQQHRHQNWSTEYSHGGPAQGWCSNSWSSLYSSWASRVLSELFKTQIYICDCQGSSWFAVSWWSSGRLQIHLASQNLIARRPFFRSVFSLSYFQALLTATRLVLARPTTAKGSSQKDDFCYSSVKDDQSCLKVVTEETKQG